MGMRRMTAFPYEMLRKTTCSTASTSARVARRKPKAHTLPVITRVSQPKEGAAEGLA
mgnify:CR=1 FL=1